MISRNQALDDQASVTPQEVGAVGADPDVDLRLRQSVAAAEGEEAALELAAGGSVGRDVADRQVEGASSADRVLHQSARRFTARGVTPAAMSWLRETTPCWRRAMAATV
jgi:hypothetical protein